MPEHRTSKRSSGLLMPISSLPGPFGIGDLGYEAYAFADFLFASGQTIWQVLPVVPLGHGHSPYSSPSTFAGNPLFISPELLMDDGLLSDEDLVLLVDAGSEAVQYQLAAKYKNRVMNTAWHRFTSGVFPQLESEYASFRRKNRHWLIDYALFEAIKLDTEAAAWTDWPAGLRDREAAAIAEFTLRKGAVVEEIMFTQFMFERQWAKLRAYCEERGITLFGDLPIYVAQDSAEVWSNRAIFCLDETGQPTVVSGVPPDYFSETGQRWGNPLYNWDVLKSRDYDWWVARIGRIMAQFDLVRLDHFRGFEAYWEIPASEPTAIHGSWRIGPGRDFFEALERQLGPLPVIAENLGVITDGVTDLMNHFGFPGMAILQFAFNAGPENDFLPHNYSERIVAYTGTHDNDTLVGWWSDTSGTQDGDQIARERRYCAEYLGLTESPGLNDESPRVDGTELTWKAIRSLMLSKAEIVITPVQDVLSLGSSARMNTPGTTEKNWVWRVDKKVLTPEIASRLAALTVESHRLGSKH